jgi:hypothetical protein
MSSNQETNSTTPGKPTTAPKIDKTNKQVDATVKLVTKPDTASQKTASSEKA